MSDPARTPSTPDASDAADPSPRPLSFFERISRQSLTWAIGAAFESSAKLGTQLPRANPERHGLTVDRDIAYRSSSDPAHTLDVYRPVGADGPLPVVLYIHGGGFRILSKDTHWVMAVAFARRGYVVFSVNYRLAPDHPFPAAPADVCAAYQWVLDHAEDHGGDPGRIVVSGESAGANLATVVAIASCVQRPEPWAKAVFERGVVPSAVVPACGILQVSDPQRFVRLGLSNRITQPVIDSCCANYVLGDPVAAISSMESVPEHCALADPLCVIEAHPPARPYPPFYIPCGTADPLIDDSRRLGAAVRAHGGIAQVSEFAGMGHAFHAWLFREQARLCWAETHAFLDHHLGRAPADERS